MDESKISYSYYLLKGMCVYPVPESFVIQLSHWPIDTYGKGEISY